MISGIPFHVIWQVHACHNLYEHKTPISATQYNQKSSI